ncbi:Peptide-N4-(N-acetyl-beta-glucosaminyl)asparagine amidase A [Heracleum sosnowskyi]|uniref:Peptide-N4-(N-acetyl-beta-glucosaminyl)asparagine amidase A n=1 Tax=Heracleum sosnowskyi TaxID=360622 RepID=A0AAD8NCS1_9APIA|nr:Peptide-N4-(N-acetyl-beta-glucosaminyl)asparagine amidase A [Heracleum sosnowskyi]
MAFSLLSLILFSLYFFHSTAKLPKSSLSLFRSQFSEALNDEPPTTFFEVTKPIEVPNTKPCSQLILQHDFGYTYNKPPVLADYKPSFLNCPSQDFSRIVLEWKATCKGRQFDRIFGVWLGGVELLRSCTAEPRPNGIVWNVKKDVTRYYSLLMTNQTLAVYLGNIIDDTYTGVYHVELSFHFYPAENRMLSWGNLGHGYGSNADLILPISRDLPLNDGLWFEVVKYTDVMSKKFKIPQNAYKAVLEVYVSPHENDESWYTNLPNEYIAQNNLTDLPGNGPFREVVVSMDGKVVGAVWPFSVIYTGGVNPLLWRPISAIGSFDLPSYDIEITPILGTILDGKTHEFGFSVTNALNVWYIDANLHIWLDGKSKRTEGKVLRSSTSPHRFTHISNFTGLNGTFLTRVSRLIDSIGWVKSSYGKITTQATQEFNFSNFMEMGSNGDLQIVHQRIDFIDTIVANSGTSVDSVTSLKRFPLYLYLENADQEGGTYTSVSNLSLGFNEKIIKKSEYGSSVSSLENLQKGQASMLVKGNLVVSGTGSTQQAYSFDSSKSCYFRNVSSSNYTIIYDEENNKCNKRTQTYWGLGLHRWWHNPVRSAFLSSNPLKEKRGFNSP